MKKRLPVFLIATVLTVILTVVINSAITNFKYTNRDRVIILAYQTNITGSDAENWQNNLKNTFSFEFEVSVYTTNSAGNESITITTENGWQQVVTRLGAKQGDILLLNQVAYETMLNNAFLLPIDFEGNNAIKADGVTYGIDISGKTAEGLTARDTSKYVGAHQPLPIYSIDDSPAIAVIYKGAKHPEMASEVILSLWGDK